MVARSDIENRAPGKIGIGAGVLAALLALTGAGEAKADPTAQAPCSREEYRQFDFWIGTWQVFRTDSGVLAGVDTIEPILNGCALRQTWIQLDDSFRPEGAAYRLRGESILSVLPNGQWRQTWADNSGYFNTLTGGLNEHGVMVLESGPVSYPGERGHANVYFRWQWQLREDGTIRNSGETKIGDDGIWETSFDNIYKPNR